MERVRIIWKSTESSVRSNTSTAQSCGYGTFQAVSKGAIVSSSNHPSASFEQLSPLPSLDDWEQDLLRRYPEPVPTSQANAHSPADDAFRNYDDSARDGVREFYRLNHAHQTVDFVRGMREKYLPLRQRRMSLWEAMECLDTLIDDSDPDTEQPQIVHAVQTAEAIHADGHPDWFVLTGLIHDLGKVLCLFGEPQWAVVGDTFPVGCAFSEKIVLPEFFETNPDRHVPEYQTPCGIYEPGCGLDNVLMSWGHDEYLYQVLGQHLPVEAQYMIRYHSFYPAHREGEYEHLMNETDREMFAWVRAFNPYDLYTKHETAPDMDRLMPQYQELVAKYLPATLQW
ncbi:MAG: inositol oxygenase [Planctomycetaceae bacterium]|nr:inositol oxygenase [Planctomycetaceae bacterium]